MIVGCTHSLQFALVCLLLQHAQHFNRMQIRGYFYKLYCII